MRTRLLSPLLLLASASFLFAQSSEVPPPKPPFIARVTLPCSWTITFTRPASEETIDLASLRKFIESSMGPDASLLKSLDELKEPVAKPMVRTLRVTRTLDFAKENAKFSDNTEQTTYIFNVARITKHVAYDGLIRNRRDQNVIAISPDFSVADFSGFEWLKPENYKGIQSMQGRTCYFFEDKIKSDAIRPAQGTDPAKPDPAMMAVRAFIDVQTKLPLALQRGDETRVFAVTTPTPADLVLPPEVAAEISAWKAELTSATSAAPPP